MLLRKLAAAFALFSFSIGAAPSKPEYAVGQVWEYQTRTGEEGSLVKIQKVEALPAPHAGEKVYHVSLIGVHFKDMPAVAGEITHLPVSKATLDASVTRLSALNPTFPEPDEGIAKWREARGGVFTIPLAEIVNIVEQSIAGAPR